MKNRRKNQGQIYQVNFLYRFLISFISFINRTLAFQLYDYEYKDEEMKNRRKTKDKYTK